MKKLLMVIAVAALILSAFAQSPINAQSAGSEQEQEIGLQSDAPAGHEEEGCSSASSWTEEEQSEPEEAVETLGSEEQDSDELGN